MQGLTWDLGILIVTGILAAYSLFIRKHKALATLVSTYVAYFVATAWGERIAGFFSGERVIFDNVWIKANATPFVIQIILLLLFIVLLSTFMKLAGRRSRYSAFEVVAYAICTVALACMLILLLMEPAQRDTILASSRIAPIIYNWREWVLVIPVFVMIYFGIFGEEEG